MSNLTVSKTALKDMPKKSTLINNLLRREDDQSLSVKSEGEGSIELKLVTKTGLKHIQANKEVLDLLSKPELLQLLSGKGLTKKINYTAFNFETYMPTDAERKERTQRILAEKQQKSA